MVDQIIIMLTQGVVGWGILGVIGLIASVFVVYYISFEIYLIVASIYSGAKLIPESYRIWHDDRLAIKDAYWAGGHLGVTMADGGEPIDEENKEEKKEEKET
jgi:hypothetical protein